MLNLIKYYSRKDIQKAILSSAKDREVAVNYNMKGFGKRPDILQFENDVFELAKQGATSFHISEERWRDPLQIKTEMTKKQLDDIRIGWDLVLDVDCKFLEYSKIGAALIIDALKFHNVKSYSIKFSGGSGFHIGVPFEAFPNTVNGVKTNLLFPEGIRVVASYIKNMIKEPLVESLKPDIDIISKSLGKTKEEMSAAFDPFLILDIDAVLIASRHLFRSPYSINEKKSLISVPIKPEQLKSFSLVKAKPENIDEIIAFLDREEIEPKEASHLITQAFDWSTRHKTVTEKDKESSKKLDQSLSKSIAKQYFPPCITKGLNGLADGKKRFLFVLINFLKSTGHNLDEIEKIVHEWNAKNPEPLRENYVNAQLSWHKRQKEIILPPNCSNSAYYKDLQICSPAFLCNRIKNPVNFSILSIRNRNITQPEEKKKKTTRQIHEKDL